MSGTKAEKGRFEDHDGIQSNSRTKGQMAILFLVLTAKRGSKDTNSVNRESVSLHIFKAIL